MFSEKKKEVAKGFACLAVAVICLIIGFTLVFEEVYGGIFLIIVGFVFMILGYVFMFKQIKVNKEEVTKTVSKLENVDFDLNKKGLIFEYDDELYGKLSVYDDRVVIAPKYAFKAVLEEKELFYCDIIGVQFQQDNTFISKLDSYAGYIQFETASINGSNNLNSENTFKWKNREMTEIMVKVKNYTREKVRQYKTGRNVIQEAPTAAGELIKWKELLDSGIISQEEFDQKKKDLLNK